LALKSFETKSIDFFTAELKSERTVVLFIFFKSIERRRY